MALALIAGGELVAGALYASAHHDSDRPPAATRTPGPAAPSGPSDQSGQAGQAGLGTYSPAPTPATTATTVTASTTSTLGRLVSASTPTTTPTATNGSASGPVASSPGPTTPPPVATTVPTPVSCETDLSLTSSPDQAYNFLCRQGSTPLTWATSAVRIYTQGLSAVQTAAFTAALGQWESDAHFTATQVTTAAGADVVFTTAPLKSDAPGYTEDGYTTVSYRCDPHCTYDHAAVVLSSTAGLTQTDWLSTMLHELGHVAGLNHVSQKAEVMYPFLTISSPVVFAAGDQAGLEVLAAERGA